MAYSSIRTRQLSVFSIMYRTNNVAEVWVLHRRLGVHPSLWIFTGGVSKQKKIHLLQSITRTEYMSPSMGTSIRRNAEARYIAHEAILQGAWQL